jgi:hypothetical protein
MSVFELDISWAATARERRSLHWGLIACDEVRAVFLTARDDVLAVLFRGDRRAFELFSRRLQPERAWAWEQHGVPE